ncbi:MAG: helix-turn-helix transcriptional regulator, partial [Deltaproteobacteria bacterium]|nr:helix-turn-helix transcriptional regulator [Deltaproteobacteria bacterium]
QVGGSSEWKQGRRVHRVGATGAYAVAPGVMHELARPPKADHHYAFAIVDVDAICARMPELSPAWATDEPFRVFSGDRLVSPFRRVLEEASVRASFRNRALRLAVEQLVVVATRELIGTSWEKVLSAPRVVEEARRLMDARPGEPWKLTSLARAVGASPSHLGALFTKSVGVPPHRYLLERRIALAREWLLESDRPITSIAIDVGFASSQHFAKAFRNATGVSARLFRRGVRG